MSSGKESHSRFTQLQLFRMLFAALLAVFLAEVFELGTSELLLGSSAIIGVHLGSRCAKADWNLGKTLFSVIAILVIGRYLLQIGNGILLSLFSGSGIDLLAPRLSDHLFLITLFALPGFLFTWSYWRYANTALFEFLSITASLLWLLSGHRNYQLDAPQKMSQAAFALGVEPQNALLFFAAIFFLGGAAFLALSSVRPLFHQKQITLHSVAPRRLQTTGIIIALSLIFAGYLYGVDRYYTAQLSRASNGVGQKNEEGESPLGFHSAAGKTKQPAALVRLEGGYKENPWAPMLYLREGALSKFNGRELVIAPPEFDADVPRVAPGQPFSKERTGEDPLRKQVVQSVYLLTKHRTLFAIDYPQSVRVIRNPDPNRFSLAYQALSIAPTAKPQDLIGEEVGDSSWDEATWAHYLRAPASGSEEPSTEEFDLSSPKLDGKNEDRRYRLLASRLNRELVNDGASPVERALGIIQYLSKESIYTRTPGHPQTSGGDPVAPYLFSEEKRGYCVHFAHAAVYLLRSLGIPARIATGYLTDLSFAKDGHVLLQMGDRHAWPEIYVRGVGWTVFDVNPARAENEQTLVPDESLLDELMQKLDPAEQFIAPPPTEEKKETPQQQLLNMVTSRAAMAILFFSIIVTLFALKLFQWFGWRIYRDHSRRIRGAYAASAAILADLGFIREAGETRSEFSNRIGSGWGIHLTPLTESQQRSIYGKVPVTPEEIHTGFSVFRSSLVKATPRWRRFISFFNPRSLSKVGRW